jgi:hypothetical protein
VEGLSRQSAVNHRNGPWAPLPKRSGTCSACRMSHIGNFRASRSWLPPWYVPIV